MTRVRKDCGSRLRCVVTIGWEAKGMRYWAAIERTGTDELIVGNIIEHR